jgi:tetratricopeptide (TPR) repeat protein
MVRLRAGIREHLVFATATLIAVIGPSPYCALGSDEPEVVERRIDDISDVPAAARLAMLEAQELREAGDPDAAVDLLLGFLEEHPDQDHFLLQFHLGATWARRGDLEEALAAYQASVRMEPLFAQGWLNLGELAYNMGRYELAASSLAYGYDVSEWKEPNVLFFRAAALVMDGRPVEAVPILEGLISEASGRPTIEWHRALIMACLELEDRDRGGAAVERMLAQHGESPDAWRLAFQYYASAGEYDDAAVALTIGGYMRPLTRTEEMTLGDLFLAIGVPSRAGALYESALADSSSVADLERLASAHLAAYEFDPAFAALDRALALEPTPHLWSLLGDLHFMRRDYQSSFAAYRSCVEADSTLARAHLMMGYCAIQLDRPAEAIAPLERAAAFPELGDKAGRLLSAVRSLTGK